MNFKLYPIVEIVNDTTKELHLLETNIFVFIGRKLLLKNNQVYLQVASRVCKLMSKHEEI